MSIAYYQIVRVLWKSDTIPGHRESRNTMHTCGCKSFPIIFARNTNPKPTAKQFAVMPPPAAQYLFTQLRKRRFAVQRTGRQLEYAGSVAGASQGGQNVGCRCGDVCRLLLSGALAQHFAVCTRQ